MGHLYFARHGQTVWNVENKICGATDIELTELGHQQAEELGQAILEQGIQIDEILYLPSPRSTEPSILPVPHSVSMHPHAPVVRNRAVSHQEDSRSLASLLSFLRYVSQSLQVLFQHHIHNHACRL